MVIVLTANDKDFERKLGADQPFKMVATISICLSGKSQALSSAACISLIFTVAAAPLLVAAVDCVDEGLKGHVT